MKRNLEKVPFRGTLSTRPFQWLDVERNLEKVQQEEKPFKPFQGKINLGGK